MSSDNEVPGKGVVASSPLGGLHVWRGGKAKIVVSPKPKWPVLLSLCGLVSSAVFQAPRPRLPPGPSLGNGDNNNADGDAGGYVRPSWNSPGVPKEI